MAEAGGAIGALSLGLQLLKGLKVYYGHFKSFHDDIAATHTRIDRLEASLSLLLEPVQRLDVDNNNIPEQARGCIVDCFKALNKLKLFHEKCSEPKHNQGTLEMRIKEVRERITYPFRK